MMTAVVYATNNQGDQEEACRLTTDENGRVVPSVRHSSGLAILNSPLINPETGRKVTRDSGDEFLKLLPSVYSGSRLRVALEVDGTKGDLPGHPFRGNQWSGGQGGSERFPSSSGKVEDIESKRIVAIYNEKFGSIDRETYSPEEISSAISKRVANMFAEAQGKETKELTEREKTVLDMHEKITGYTSSGYRAINRKLRKDEVLTEKEKNTVDMIESLQKDMDEIVYRGIGSKLEKDAKKMKIGMEIESKGLQSTSLNPFMAMAYSQQHGKGGYKGNPTFMEIRVHRATPLPTFHTSHEAELILSHGTKYKVVGFKEADFIGSPTGKINLVQIEQL